MMARVGKAKRLRRRARLERRTERRTERRRPVPMVITYDEAFIAMGDGRRIMVTSFVETVELAAQAAAGEVARG